ncbi:hypothetical protein ACROYT_G028085 [Oculina patagonica]
MTFVITSLGWSFLLVAISAASTNVSVSKPSTQKPGQGTIVVPPDEKCRTVVNGNYYAGTNKEMKAILQGIQAQLSEVQEQLREMNTDNRSKTGNYRNCADVYKSGERISGVYTINPDDGDPFDVYCDQKTASGGWTVIQKRLDGSVDFYRGWADYKRGFGNLNGEFWLGLDKMHRLTKTRNKIRVDLEDTKGKTAYADYDMFAVASERAKYQLSLGTYSGTAGDSFAFQRGGPFSTKDQDNDPDSRHCAVTFKGGWWYTTCRNANLNGLYHHGASLIIR